MPREKNIAPENEKKVLLPPRPPVVAVMGHVDHGKTTLLSAFRKTDLTRKEFGGISQHIGAYEIKVKRQIITFIDTPGHAVFTQMRERGAKVTDIVVLVVAANEGVKPQTKEAVDHARAAGVPIIVAINKIDLPTSDTEKVKRELAEAGLTPEAWGGDTVTVEVSAKTGKGLDDLLEMILLVGDMAELTADPAALFTGIVLESSLDARRGPVATVLVKEGILRVGDEVFSGGAPGKVKALIDDRGQRVKEAYPSMPVLVLGLEGVPEVGSAITSQRAAGELKHSQAAVNTSSTRAKDLNIVLKSDVEGTLEAIRSALGKLAAETKRIRLILAAAGDIGEADVLLAKDCRAVVLGFNVKMAENVSYLAETSGVPVKTFRVVYELLEEAEKLLAGAGREEEKKAKGAGEVIRVFTLPRSGSVVAGVRVTGGILRVGDRVAVSRQGELLAEAKIKSIHEKAEEKKQAAAGVEVGVLFSPQITPQIGDRLEIV